MTISQLDRHELLLERQGVDGKSSLSPLEWIHKLGGLQAQEKLGPYFGLAARVRNFTAKDLDKLRLSKQVLRGTFQRRTVHLLTRQDFAAWHCLYEDRAIELARREGLELEPDWRQTFRAAFKPGQELASGEVLAMADQLFNRNVDRFSNLNMAFMSGLGLVRTFGEDGKSLGPQEKWVFFEDFTGESLGTDTDSALRSMVERYLGAFGPATASDFAYWSGLRSPRKLMEQWAEDGLLWSGLNEAGKAIYDLPQLNRTATTVPMPDFQLLGDFDNLILGHQDRTHIMVKVNQTIMNKNLRCMNPLLHQGWMMGVWDVRTSKAHGLQVKVEPYRNFSPAERVRLTDLALDRARQVLPDEGEPTFTWMAS